MATQDRKAPALSYSTTPIALSEGVTIQYSLTRRAKNSGEVGPGLFVLSAVGDNRENKTQAKATLDPEPLQKWAEEGFTVAQITVPKLSSTWDSEDDFAKAIEWMKALNVYDGLKGVIVYGCDRSLNNDRLESLNSILGSISQIKAIVTYVPGIKHESPTLIHQVSIPGSSNVNTTIKAGDAVYSYENVPSTNFVIPGHPDYEAGAAGLAHSRSLAFIKKRLDGPYFDLERIWDEHTLFEFGERNVEKTMSTMVEEPYVNHIPTLTGGIGRKALTDFYRNHFIFSNPEDTKLELVSRTVGTDRVIDEFIFSFTHDRVVDWLIPGIPPTHKQVRIPFTSIVNIRGDRLFHEHIAWDQATVLRQLGLLPKYLPFPYPLPDGRAPAAGKRFEYRVPTAGVQTAEKLVDESSVLSNQMLRFEIREVDDV
ncbi:hypothetical protein F5884DRAFT_232028 [Xylogone sp. PMI_703]|nr:hypothetical protein F5884DRAFT_232028 [Xylogone sp. PMI_703]